MDVRAGPERGQRAEELMLSNERHIDLLLIGRTDAEAETPILWPPDAKN